MARRVSIVIPTYNQAAYLPAGLDAAWFQDYQDIEIIVVDDGSTDATPQIIGQFRAAVATETASYAAHYNTASDSIERVEHPRYPQVGRRLICLRHEANRGLGATLNTGMAAASGEYVTYIASDDWLLPDMARELAAILDSGADLAYADMHIVDDAGRILRRFSLPDYTFEAAFGHWYLCGVCKLYRRELHARHGLYREDLFAHDHELYQRFAMAGARLAHVPRVLACVRHHGPSRQVDNHRPANWQRLMEESKALVRQAREFLAQKATPRSEG